MTQVNVLEAKNKLSYLIRMLEDGTEDSIIISRNGVPVVQMVLLPKTGKKTIIGAARGEFHCPQDINRFDDEIAELIRGSL